MLWEPSRGTCSQNIWREDQVGLPEKVMSKLKPKDMNYSSKSVRHKGTVVLGEAFRKGNHIPRGSEIFVDCLPTR